MFPSVCKSNLLVALLFSLAWTTAAQQQQVNNAHFDYVILGGGTAGLVVANRLTEDPTVTVAIIEAGTFEKNNPNVTTNTKLGAGRDTDIDWQYSSEPQKYTDNQRISWSAGKGLGGSSLINGMTYMRPSSSQLNLWPSLGLEMNWEIVFNYSKKGEQFQPPPPNLTAVGASYEAFAHGFTGPLTTCTSPGIIGGNVHNIFNATFKNLGIHPNPEFDGGELPGFGTQITTQNATALIREDAARAYYYPFTNRKNLVAIVNTTATRLIWAPKKYGSGMTASAAEVVDQNGKVSKIYANREIILSAGAIRSPAILEYSGVGNPKILSAQSVPVVIDLPSVGENFQDQNVITMTGLVKNAYPAGFPPFVVNTMFKNIFGSNASSVYKSTLAKLPQYASTIAAQNGGASNASVQQHLLKTQLDLLYNSNTPSSEIAPIALLSEIGVVFWPLQPFSRGSAHINTTDMTKQPQIISNFLQFDFDGEVSVATAKLVRNFFTTEPLSKNVNMSSLVPSFKDVPRDASDETWLNWIKTSPLQPNCHHLGTCAMLPKDMGGVVDNDFMVYGTENVRVVDLSVIPLQVAGHSTALLYGVAEWASQKIKNGSK